MTRMDANEDQSTSTQGEIAAHNIEHLMTVRRLSQEGLARRMTTLGFSWYRKTVARVVSSERRVNVDELYALALALDTRVEILIAPLDHKLEAERPGTTPFIEIGRLPAVIQGSAGLVLTDGFEDPIHIPSTRVEWEDDEELPSWRFPRADSRLVLAKAMRRHLASQGIEVAPPASEIEIWDIYFRSKEE